MGQQTHPVGVHTAEGGLYQAIVHMLGDIGAQPLAGLSNLVEKSLKSWEDINTIRLSVTTSTAGRDRESMEYPLGPQRRPIRCFSIGCGLPPR